VIFFGALGSEATASVDRMVGATAAEAVRLNFSRAAERAIWWQAGAFCVAFLLGFLLPRKSQKPST
jgi:hypothetical protein